MSTVQPAENGPRPLRKKVAVPLLSGTVVVTVAGTMYTLTALSYVRGDMPAASAATTSSPVQVPAKPKGDSAAVPSTWQLTTQPATQPTDPPISPGSVSTPSSSWRPR